MAYLHNCKSNWSKSKHCIQKTFKYILHI